MHEEKSKYYFPARLMFTIKHISYANDSVIIAT